MKILKSDEYINANPSCPFINGLKEIKIEEISTLPCYECSIRNCKIQKINDAQIDGCVGRCIDLVRECYGKVKNTPSILAECITEYTGILKDRLASSAISYSLTDGLAKYNRLRYSYFDLYAHMVGDENVLIAQVGENSLLDAMFIYKIALGDGNKGDVNDIIHSAIEDYSGKVEWDGYNLFKPFLPLVHTIWGKVEDALEKEGLYCSEDNPYVTFETGIDPNMLDLVLKIESPTSDQKLAFRSAVRDNGCNITEEGDTLVVPLIDILFYKHSNSVPSMLNKAFSLDLPKFNAVMKKKGLCRIIPV